MPLTTLGWREWLALPEHERAQTFQAQPLWQRALIVLAGPVMNVLIAVAIFAAFNMAYGKPALPEPERWAAAEQAWQDALMSLPNLADDATR